MECSVVICTHNPRKDYLQRVLDGLQVQTLSRERWELLVIDNASRESLSQAWDLSWHPHARILHESQLGLTYARLRGIKESAGEWLVFVDDDNLLAVDYLEQALRIAVEWPTLGAYGASISAEFEAPPPNWALPYLEGLAIRELDRDYWANLGGWSLATPCGAGLCVRRAVGLNYLQKANASEFRKMLGRSGLNLGAGEDSDLAECAVDMGLGTGRFAALKLVHLIPRNRMTADYIVRLYAGLAGSQEMLASLRPKSGLAAKRGWEGELRFWFNFFKAKGIQKRIVWASHQARKRSRRLMAALPPAS
jgi:glycosyltransferase involved in cell wall biosynthesis